MQLGEVRREGHVVELAAVEPDVEPPERAGVGPSGVWADGGLDQPARGLSSVGRSPGLPKRAIIGRRSRGGLRPESAQPPSRQ